MNTAITSQILDSNNNNISPATCVESLYFEMTSDNTRYRMSLRGHFLVADNTVNWKDYSNIDSGSTEYSVPFTYARAVEGTEGTLYQLRLGHYDVASVISNYISSYVDEHCISKDKEDDYFHRVETSSPNTISTDIVMTKSSSTYLTLGKSGTKRGILWKDPSACLLRDESGNLELSTIDKTVTLSGNKLDASAFSYITLGNKSKNTDISLSGKKIEMVDSNNAQLSITGGNVTFDNSKSFSVNAETISLNASRSVDIPSNTSLNIYGKKFPVYSTPTEEGTYKYLTVQNNGELAWNDVEKVSVIPATDESQDANTFEIKNIQFDDQTIVNLVKDKQSGETEDKNVRLRAFVDSANPNVAFTLQATDIQKSLYFATINNQAIIGNSPVSGNFDFVEKNNDTWTNITSGVSHTKESAGSFVSEISFTEGKLEYKELDGITYSGGALSCKQYIMTSSDERLKTDIRDIEYSGRLPEIVQFRWKDTSALSYGVIAQEAERCGLSDLVRENPETGMKTLSYTELLLLYIKELQVQNKSLTERVERLENEVFC